MEAIREFLSETRKLTVSIQTDGLSYDIIEPKETGLIECENGDLCLMTDFDEVLAFKSNKITNVIYTSDATGYERLEIKLGESSKVVLATETRFEDL